MQIRHVSPKHSGVIQCSMAFAKVPTESQGNFVLTVASKFWNSKNSVNETKWLTLGCYKNNVVTLLSLILFCCITEPPEPPLLQVHPGIHKGIFREGETIQATCRISNARPIANISWFLGEVLLKYFVFVTETQWWSIRLKR